MASLSSLSLAPSLNFPSASSPVPSSSSSSCCAFPFLSSRSSPFRVGQLKHSSSRLLATADDDEWGADPSNRAGRPETLQDAAQSVATAVVEEATGIADLKKCLIDNLYGTDRGLKATSEVRAEIVELITQLEAKNPTPAPTEALPLLNGKWILAYTSFSELFPLLAAGTLPLVKVGEISQFIDSNALTVENLVTFTGPLATTSFSAYASFEVRGPKRVQIKFEEGVIGTPQLTDSIEIPENVDFLGQKIDLTPFRGLLRSLQSAASSVVRTISGQPPLKFPIRARNAQSWLLTTYLDQDLRISRGDGGSIFVLLKEGSPLLTY